MGRTRISTTVDAERLERCRTLVAETDSRLLDRALRALLRELEGERERRALDAQPYEDDAEVAWSVPAGPDLPYDGEVPAEVRRLAAERRARYES